MATTALAVVVGTVHQSRLCRGDVVRGRAKLIVMLSQEHRDHAAVQRLLTDATDG